jgi:hypothetical protein
MLRVDRVGLNDNFFDLGGHSLTAMRVTGQIRSVLAVDVPLRTLLQNPRLEDFATEAIDLLVEANGATEH